MIFGMPGDSPLWLVAPASSLMQVTVVIERRGGLVLNTGGVPRAFREAVADDQQRVARRDRRRRGRAEPAHDGQGVHAVERGDQHLLVRELIEDHVPWF